MNIWGAAVHRIPDSYFNIKPYAQVFDYLFFSCYTDENKFDFFVWRISASVLVKAFTLIR